MTSWKVYVLCAAILPLAETKNDQGGYKLETTTISNQPESIGHEDMSEEHKIKVGNRIEPVIFEPQQKIKPSRSTYKVTSYMDFKPYKQSFKQFGQYIRKFLINLQDPNYISTLYNADKPRENLQLGGVQEQNNSLHQLHVGKQPIGAESKISSYNLKGKRQRFIKSIWKPLRNS